MIAQVSGIVSNKTARSIIVDVHGLGYEVFCTKDLILRLGAGAEVTFFTHLNVKEDALDLYGFTSTVELNFFKLLLTVSGIGPKSALNILEVAKPEDIRRAVARQEPAILAVVHGIGKKTAEKIVLELKDKVEILEPDIMSDDQAVLEAITSLGYSQTEARAALRNLKGNEGVTIEDKVKAVLRSLSRAA